MIPDEEYCAECGEPFRGPEPYVDGLCEDCAIGRAEAAAERLHEGEPPISVTERAQLAHQQRRQERGY